MKKLLHSPRRVLALVTVLLLINSQMPSSIARPVGLLPGNIVSAVMLKHVTPQLHSLSVRILGGESEPPVMDLDANLWLQNRNLQLRLDEALSLIEQLSGARQHFRLVEPVLQPAAVSVAATNRRRPTLTINQGALSGVRRGQVVVAGRHGVGRQGAPNVGIDLLGRVNQTRPLTARVELISTQDQVLEVRFAAPTSDAPMRAVRALLRYDAQQRAYFGDIAVRSSEAKLVKKGDLAILADPNWPEPVRGFVVGQVSHVEPSEHPLQKRIVVRPRLDPARLVSVIVVIL